jgi:hypothetical protein
MQLDTSPRQLSGRQRSGRSWLTKLSASLASVALATLCAVPVASASESHKVVASVSPNPAICATAKALLKNASGLLARINVLKTLSADPSISLADRAALEKLLNPLTLTFDPDLKKACGF